MKVFGLLRVPPEQEHEGLDISHHGGSAYPKELAKLEKGADISQHGGILAVRWGLSKNIFFIEIKKIRKTMQWSAVQWL